MGDYRYHPTETIQNIKTGSGVLYPAHDGLGSVTDLTDQSGALQAQYAYSTFGCPCREPHPRWSGTIAVMASPASGTISFRVLTLRLHRGSPHCHRAPVVWSRRGPQNCRDTAATSPTRRLAAPTRRDRRTSTTRLSRPRDHRTAARAHPESTPRRPAPARHPGHDPALAPQPAAPPLGEEVPPDQRPSGHSPEHQIPGSAYGPRESGVGLPTDPRRAGRPRSHGGLCW